MGCNIIKFQTISEKECEYGSVTNSEGLSKDESALIIQNKLRAIISRKNNRDLLVNCYSCGKKFRLSDYKIHVNNCYDVNIKKYRKVIYDVLRPKKVKMNDEIPNRVDEIEEYNKKSVRCYNKSKPRCPTCKKKIKHSKFMEHLSVCKNKETGKVFDEEEYCANMIIDVYNNYKKKRSQLVCYLCGKKFKNLQNHINYCIEKWELEMKKLPQNLQLQIPDVELELPKKNSSNEEIKDFNNSSRTIFLQQSIPKCSLCNDQRYIFSKYLSHVQNIHHL